jgi:hypothetical protein
MTVTADVQLKHPPRASPIVPDRRLAHYFVVALGHGDGVFLRMQGVQILVRLWDGSHTTSPLLCFSYISPSYLFNTMNA